MTARAIDRMKDRFSLKKGEEEDSSNFHVKRQRGGDIQRRPIVVARKNSTPGEN